MDTIQTLWNNEEERFTTRVVWEKPNEKLK